MLPHLAISSRQALGVVHDRHGQAYAVCLAGAADLPALVAIYNQAVRTKQATADLEPVTIVSREPWFEAHQQPKRPLYVLLKMESRTTETQDAVADTLGRSDTLVAWGCFSDLYARPAYHISSEISLYLHEAYHGRGLGKALLAFMLSQAADLDIRQVVALIFAHNAPSLALFERAGFERWGHLPAVCDMQGFVADVVMLGRSV